MPPQDASTAPAADIDFQVADTGLAPVASAPRGGRSSRASTRDDEYSLGMFVQSLKFIDAHKTGNGNGGPRGLGRVRKDISVYGQESKVKDH